MLVAKGKQLLRLNDDLSTTPLAALNSADPLSYTEYNGNVYWTNKSTIGWLPADSYTARPVGVPVPEIVPTLSAGLGGLLPGRYGVILTYLDERREEGGATEVQLIDLPKGGGIQLNNLPQRMGWTLRIYITDPDGETFHFAEEIPAVFPNYTVAETASGGDCNTQFLTPMPAGEFITWLGGRLYTAKFGTLYFSEALRPHLYNRAHNVIPFSGYISFVEAVTDGLYVGDSRGVWFLGGTDPTQFTLKLVSPHRAVRRSGTKVGPGFFPESKVPSPNPVVLWLGVAGYVVGMDGGTTAELQSDRVRVPLGLVGRTTVLVRRGMKQAITPVNSTSTVAFGTAVDSVISWTGGLIDGTAPTGSIPDKRGFIEISDVNNLQKVLDSKSDVGHHHVPGDIYPAPTPTPTQVAGDEDIDGGTFP
jgi:hypothetical protein